MGKSKVKVPSKLNVHNPNLAIDAKLRRLAISGPIGPVKNSRGADFCRSDTLIVVSAINDCVTEADTTKENQNVSHESLAKKTEESQVCDDRFHQSSTTTLSTTTNSAVERPESRDNHEPPKLLKKTLFNSFIPKPHLASMSSLTLKYTIKDAKQYENFAADKLCRDEGSAPKLGPKVPKSRTMTALQELKNSVSRPSNLSSTVSTFFASKPDTPPADNDVINMASLNRRDFIVEESRAPTNWSPRAVAPELLPGQVDTAQPSAYWTGRFVALHDRFSTEHMSHVMPNVSTPPSTPSSSGYLRRASQASRDSDVNSYSDPPNHLQNDIDLCRRVFSHLTSMCVTGEARQSLRRWQEDYARRRNRPQLLPEGCAVQNKGIVSRLFGSRARQPDRMGQAFLEEAYYSNASNAFGFTTHGTEARYLNFR